MDPMINLLPWREQQIFYKNNIFIAISLIGAIILLIIALLLRFSLSWYSNAYDDDLIYLNQQIEEYTGKIKEIEGLKERKQLLLTRLDLINKLQSKRYLAVSILDHIAKSIPTGVILDKVTSKDNILSLSGSTESTSMVSVFIKNLESKNILKNSKLNQIKSSQNVDESLAYFELESIIVGIENVEK